MARKAKERAVEPVAHAEGHKEARGQRECGIGELGQPAMADADPANMPSTQHERLYQRVDEVEEMPGKLWARWNEARLGGERAGARWSSRRQWRQLRLSFLPVSQT